MRPVRNSKTAALDIMNGFKKKMKSVKEGDKPVCTNCGYPSALITCMSCQKEMYGL